MQLGNDRLERELRAWASGYTLALLLSVAAVGWSLLLWWSGGRDLPSGFGLLASALATMALGGLTYLHVHLRRERTCAKCREAYTLVSDRMAIVCLCGRCMAHVR